MELMVYSIFGTEITHTPCRLTFIIYILYFLRKLFDLFMKVLQYRIYLTKICPSHSVIIVI